MSQTVLGFAFHTELATLHMFIFYSKAFIIGTYHNANPVQLQLYLYGFCFSFNRRRQR